MGVRADRVLNWVLVRNDVQTIRERVTERDVENQLVRGWIEQAEHSVLIIRRKLIGLRGFTPDTGETKGSFTYETQGGRLVPFAHLGPASEQYVCERDSIDVVDLITGEAFQTQRWELVTKFLPVSGTYYEQAVSA